MSYHYLAKCHNKSSNLKLFEYYFHKFSICNLVFFENKLCFQKKSIRYSSILNSIWIFKWKSIEANIKVHEEKKIFLRFRIREIMWWTRYRTRQTSLYKIALPMVPELQPILHSTNLLSSEMIHFVHQVSSKFFHYFLADS